ncbi:MAG: PEP-CTERM sorting domain-containing protein [Rubrivivax sp.]|nr:MAG: PEP-CTERM sorting domain-containing protein [Rubrivivax sp.]
MLKKIAMGVLLTMAASVHAAEFKYDFSFSQFAALAPIGTPLVDAPIKTVTGSITFDTDVQQPWIAQPQTLALEFTFDGVQYDLSDAVWSSFGQVLTVSKGGPEMALDGSTDFVFEQLLTSNGFRTSQFSYVSSEAPGLSFKGVMTMAPVPEPSTQVMAALGLVGLAVASRLRKPI